MIQAVIERGAGIDVGKTVLLVCTMVGPLDQEPLTETCTFGTTNADLDRLRRGWWRPVVPMWQWKAPAPIGSQSSIFWRKV